eukprot:719151_1
MGKCKSLLPKQNDPVECTTCGDTFARKYTDSHWRKHQTKLPIHSEDIPISQRVVTVKPKSNLTNLWSKSNTPKIKTKKQTNDMKYETGRNILCVLHEASRGICSDIDAVESVLLPLNVFDAKRTAIDICCNCGDIMNEHVETSLKVHFNYAVSTGDLLNNIEYLPNVQCERCHHENIMRVTSTDCGDWLFVYMDKHCVKEEFPNEWKRIRVRNCKGGISNFTLQLVTVLNGHHYWTNSYSGEQWIQWESLASKIEKLKRISSIKGADVSLLLFKRDAPLMKEDKRLSAGYCREMFDVLLPVCIVAQIESFCMNFGYEEPIYNDLGGVLLRYGRSDNVNLRTALNFWKNKMNES